eukprot:scpid97438/ scgid24009/ 
MTIGFEELTNKKESIAGIEFLSSSTDQPPSMRKRTRPWLVAGSPRGWTAIVHWSVRAYIFIIMTVQSDLDEPLVLFILLLVEIQNKRSSTSVTEIGEKTTSSFDMAKE